MVRIALLVLISLLASACGSAPVRPSTVTMRDIKTVALVVPDAGQFTVKKARAESYSTATLVGAVAGGVIGAMIADAVVSSKNKSRDEKDAETLAASVVDFATPATLRHAIAHALTAGSAPFAVTVLDKEPEPAESRHYDAVAVVNIKSWGLHLARGEAERLSAFVELSTTMARTGSDEKLWEDDDTVLGYGRYHLTEYREDSRLLRQELSETIERVASALTTQLLFPKEATK